MTEEEERMVIIALSMGVLPYQKARLEEIALATRKSQSELVREALTYLFGVYAKLGY